MFYFQPIFYLQSHVFLGSWFGIAPVVAHNNKNFYYATAALQPDKISIPWISHGKNQS